MQTMFMKRAAFGAAAMLLAGAAQAAGVPGQGTWEITLLGRDIDGNPIDQLSPNTVFLYDTELDITWLRDANVNGTMTSETANGWARNYSIAGYYGWRLPTMEYGEMAHLWYEELGNTAGGPITNTGSFQNLQSGSYWLGTQIWPSRLTRPSAFSTADGSETSYRPLNTFYAMAVRQGDVTALPEPGTGAMMLVAFGAFAVAVRRRPA
jgi:hypothetical protein